MDFSAHSDRRHTPFVPAPLPLAAQDPAAQDPAAQDPAAQDPAAQDPAAQSIADESASTASAASTASVSTASVSTASVSTASTLPDAEPREPPGLDDDRAWQAILSGTAGSGLAPFQFGHLEAATASQPAAGSEPDQPAELQVCIELGRAELEPDQLSEIQPGSVIRLMQSSEAPVDLLIQGRLIGRGEVLVLNDRFCVRLVELLTRDL